MELNNRITHFLNECKKEKEVEDNKEIIDLINKKLN